MTKPGVENFLPGEQPAVREHSTSEALWREVDTFVVQPLQFAGRKALHKIDSPLSAAQTAVELGAAFGMGYGMKYLTKRGYGSLVTSIAAVSTASLAKNMIGTSTEVATAWNDAWDGNSSSSSRAKVSESLGGVLCDGLFYSAAAWRGHVAAGKALDRAQYLAELKDLGIDKRSMAQILDYYAGPAARSIPDRYGSAFAIDENTLVTNKHVVRGLSRRGLVQVNTPAGVELGRVTAVHPKADLALITTDVPHGVKPLRLAEEGLDLPEATRVASMGTGKWSWTRVSGANLAAVDTEPSWLQKLYERPYNWITRAAHRGTDCATAMSYLETIESAIDLKPGMSGGPLINLSDGSVIGVNAGRFMLTRKPASVFMPVENIHELIAGKGTAEFSPSAVWRWF